LEFCHWNLEFFPWDIGFFPWDLRIPARARARTFAALFALPLLLIPCAPLANANTPPPTPTPLTPTPPPLIPTPPPLASPPPLTLTTTPLFRVTLSGYAAASARLDRADRDHGAADNNSATLDLDALKLSLRAETGALGATLALLAPGPALAGAHANDIRLADALLTLTFGPRGGAAATTGAANANATSPATGMNRRSATPETFAATTGPAAANGPADTAAADAAAGITIGIGRFLSWAGLEPFDLDQRWSLAPALGPFARLVPDYHEGIRLEYTSRVGADDGKPGAGKPGKITLGAAVLDSVYADEHAIFGPLFPERAGDGKILRGDGSVRNGLGAEAMLRYETGPLALGLTCATERNYDTYNGSGELDYRLLLADIWARWLLKRTRTELAAEFIWRTISPAPGATAWADAPDITARAALLRVRQPLTAQTALAVAVALGKEQWGGAVLTRFWRASLTPTWTPCQNLELRAELSWTHYAEDALHLAKTTLFAGVQVVIKF
jgi:hypothetical protein